MTSFIQDEMPASLKKSLSQSKAEYVRLGKTGLKLSLPILGAMSFGSSKWMDWVIDNENQVLDLLKAAYDRGINTWDTANVYSNGESERFIAKAIKKFDIPRRKLVILTKCFAYVGEQPDVFTVSYGAAMTNSKDYVNQGGR